MKILVTGGAGFIGSALVRRLLADKGVEVVNLDKLTYAANLENLAPVAAHPGYKFERVDIADGDAVRAVFARHQPDAVVHLAAESHVDRSIDGPAPFIETNIVGTYRMLEAAAEYRRGLPADRAEKFRFLHVSTDEVFGALATGDAPFNENTAYAPRSPYAASKAASDHLARAWAHTYGLPVVVSNCSNNYGPYQFPEKLIPLAIVSALHGRPVPVYGKGENVRDWLYVEDHADALALILARGQIGETYLVGGRAERKNIDVANTVCAVLDRLLPDSPHRPHGSLIRFVEDRPGHDFRYAIDATRLETELGWRSRVSFEQGLEKTVMWYLTNQPWWEPLLKERYDGGRLGLGRKRA